MKILSFVIIAVLLMACGRDSDPFLIDNNRVGTLTKEIRINQLDSVFKEDSIVRNISKSQFLNVANNIEIFDRDGSPLLILEPVQQFDSTSTIGYIPVSYTHLRAHET